MMVGMSMSHTEIIHILGGPTAVAKKVGIKPPSVQGWLHDGIPDGRLKELAAEIERLSEGRFSRKTQWPDRWHLIWPELLTAAGAPPQKEVAA